MSGARPRGGPAARPAEDRDSAPWWEAVRRHELLVQRCAGCGMLRFPARVVCNRCRSRDADWVPARGTGRVVSWIVNHQPFLPGMSADEPFAVLLVRLDDGADAGADIHMYGNLVGADPSTITPGMAVEAVFVDIDDNFTLVQWRPKG
ncbi:MAG TPA: OB-fold domain-containing protein [Streptosporangiaceae bacterium]|nr:OB-fold domain-containing protein [Streptosporangiaceae bacterium]